MIAQLALSGQLGHLTDGVTAGDWWDGFIGAATGAVISTIIALIVVRVQLKNDRKMRERAEYLSATNAMLIELPAMADRASRYASGPARAAAVAERKDKNLANDCRRVVLAQLVSIPEPLATVLQRVPTVFERFSSNFGRQIQDQSQGRATPDADAWALMVKEYIDKVVDAIYAHRQGRPIDANLSPPSIPYVP